MTPEKLRSALANYYCIENWFNYPLVRDFVYTDGARAFCLLADAYWFLDIVVTEVFPYQEKGIEEFISVNMTVKGTKATIFAGDGNGNSFWSRDIEFTDCPEGEWSFYLCGGVLMLPSEY